MDLFPNEQNFDLDKSRQKFRGAPDIVSGRIVTKSYYPVSGRIFTIIRPDTG